MARRGGAADGNFPRSFCAVRMLATGEGTDPDRLGTGPTAGGKQTLTEQRLAFLFFLQCRP